MPWWLNPWAARRFWRDLARERGRMIGDAQAANAVLRQQIDFLTIERDTARDALETILRRRSESVSRGNRTRGRRRRGGLLPAPINENTDPRVDQGIVA